MPSDYQKELCSRTIDFVRFPLAVMVVFIHCCIPPVDGTTVNFSSPSGTDVFDILRITFSHVLTSIAVPMFFLISGYLFFIRLQNWDWGVWRSKLKSRVWTLLVPYIIWCGLYVLYQLWFVLRYQGASFVPDWLSERGWLHLFWDVNQWGGDRINWLEGHTIHMTSPLLTPMWFVRDLMVIVLLSPVVYWLVKKTKGFFVLLIALFYVSGVWIDIHGLTSATVFYFSAGAYFSIFGKNLIVELKRFRLPSYLLALVFLLISIRFDGLNWRLESSFKPFYIISGVIAFINFASWGVEKGWFRVNRFLVESCFFVYALHAFLINEWNRRIGFSLFDDDALLSILFYFFVPLCLVAACLMAFYVLRRVFPRLARVLVGGR